MAGKNKITLNEAGNLALTYAKHVIDDITTIVTCTFIDETISRNEYFHRN